MEAEQGKQADFNSRPREGANWMLIPEPPTAEYFNSRPREGANAFRCINRLDCINFNSRPREGANTRTF